MKDLIRRQFAVPRGPLGRMAGMIMARSNADMNRVVVDLLQLTGREHVLEIGFGPGVGLKLLLGQLPSGTVAGIDPSTVMLQQATARNREAAERGRLALRLGMAATLPWSDGEFDAVMSVNNVQLWVPLEQSLREVWRVLKPGGRFAIGVHTWALAEGKEKLLAGLDVAGFVDVTANERRAHSGGALYLLARRSG